MTQHGKIKHFIKVVSLEMLRRVIEILALCIALSFIILGCESVNLSPNIRYIPIHQLMNFFIFQTLMVFLCIKSSKRTRYYSRYYASNCGAYLIFMLLSGLFLFIFGPSFYLLFFRITSSLVLSQVVSIKRMLSCILLFHILSMLV